MISGTKWEDIPTWQSLGTPDVESPENEKRPELKNLRFSVNQPINNQIRVWYAAE
jgi:hypothetical protein